MDNLKPIPYATIGVTLVWAGVLISCMGVFANNILLDHNMAMYVWRISNVFLLIWGIGLWREKWNGGLSGLALTVMYIWFVITNEAGLQHVRLP